jgi:FKBP-type peptidyl-prolyl cis-trans isomerase
MTIPSAGRVRILAAAAVVVALGSGIYWGGRYYFSSGDTENYDQLDKEKLKEKLIGANRIITVNESELIDEMTRSGGLKMEETGTGLRYHIFSSGEGLLPVQYDTVTVAYRLSLVNGVVCYGINAPDTLRFAMGTGAASNGLEEGLRLLRPGGKARLIVPSHLGYGLLGDGEKVPAKSVLIYDVELLGVYRP